MFYLNRSTNTDRNSRLGTPSREFPAGTPVLLVRVDADDDSLVVAPAEARAVRLFVRCDEVEADDGRTVRDMLDAEVAQ